MTHPFFTPDRPRVFAHRGLRAPGDSHAENTTAAVAAALSVGAEYVESDCHVTRDGVAVLFHDESVERITGDPRLVADLTLRELDTLMSDHGGLLTVADALDGFPDARWNLDIKVDAAAGPVGTLVASHAARVLLTSFSDARRRAALAAAQAAGAPLSPATSAGRATITRSVLANLGPQALSKRAMRGVDALQVPLRHRGVPVVSDRLIRRAHAAGVEVHVWTIDDVDTMRDLIARGVDGIITDRVDVAIEALA